MNIYFDVFDCRSFWRAGSPLQELGGFSGAPLDYYTFVSIYLRFDISFSIFWLRIWPTCYHHSLFYYYSSFSFLETLLFITLILTMTPEFWDLKKKYDKHLKWVSLTHTHPPQKKTLPFGNLNATQIFLPEKQIQSVIFSSLAQLVFTWHYKADGMLITKSQRAD